MNKTSYVITRGVEHPSTGHWLPAGATVELSPRQATIMRLNGHIVPAPVQDTAAPAEEQSASLASRKLRK